MFSPAGSERICKNMLYSIVGIDYHKNRAVSTKSFENTLISAGCKKRQGKLWQKKRGLDDAYPLDKAIIVKKFRTHLRPGFVPVCRMPLQSERSLAIMLMYGKEASNRKQEIDRQHYTIPNQRPKDKHCGKI